MLPLASCARVSCCCFAGTDSFASRPAKPKHNSKKLMDKIDAKAKKGLFANAPQDPPYTRSKYLEYFRSIHYGEASLQKHGGNRRVDVQMARELSLLYARNAVGWVGGKSKVEDDVRSPLPATHMCRDRPETCTKSCAMNIPHIIHHDLPDFCQLQLWREVRFEGSPADNHEQRDLEHEQVLWERLDALIRHELEYDPNALQSGIYAEQGSNMAFKQEVPESLSIRSRDRMCPALEKSLGPAMDSRRRILFILGAQKAGTTFLFNALTKHPAFVGADHAFGCALPLFLVWIHALEMLRQIESRSCSCTVAHKRLAHAQLLYEHVCNL
jgi:hypothetical protein